MLLHQINGTAIHDNVLVKVGELADLSWRSDNAIKVKKRLRATWRSLDDQVALEEKWRKEFLAELSKEAVGGSDREKALRQIKLRESTNRRFRRIRRTLNRLKTGGFAAVEVPVLNDEGEVKGWTSITDPEELHAKVAERNRTHLNQAATTSLAHEEGYQLFHGEARHDTAKKVLNGELE